MWLSDRLQSLSDGIRRKTPGTAIIEKERPQSPPPPQYPREATIYVQKRLESAHAFTVDLNISLEEFKGIAEKVLGVPAVDQRIYQRGVLFPACCGGCRGYNDDQSLGHYDVRDGDTVMVIPRLTLGSTEYSFKIEVFARFLTHRQVSVMVDTNMLVLELKDLIVEKVNSTRDDPNKLQTVNMRLIQKTDGGFRELLNGGRLCWRRLQQVGRALSFV
ncbi:hypothetical protein BJX65DRAFT_310050 [Aspergillus insuetus]